MLSILVIKDSKKLGYDSVKDKDHINISDMPKSDFESRELTMNFFLDTVEYFDNYNFIIKTHPSEDFTFYQNFINEKCSRFKDRIALINKEYIWDILNISNIQFSRSCTTAVESWLLGLPTIELRLNKNEWYISEDFSSGSFLAINKSKAFKLIKKLSNDLGTEVIIKDFKILKLGEGIEVAENDFAAEVAATAGI